ncbi:MAG: hypothetical protein ACRC14_08175 [Paracoccaceae bacterium]
MRILRLLDLNHDLDGPVLRGVDLAVYSRAEALMDETEAWAAERQADLYRLEAEAQEAAYAEGLRQGRAAFEAAVAAYHARTTALAGEVEQLVAGAVHRVLSTWPRRDLIAAALRDLLPELSSSNEIVIAIHPSREADLMAALTDLGLKRGTGAAPYVIESRPDIAEGDCTVLTENEIIKISVPLLTRDLLASIATETTAVSARLSSGEQDRPIAQTSAVQREPEWGADD